MNKQPAFNAYLISDDKCQKYSTLSELENIDKNILTWSHLNYKDSENRTWLKNFPEIPTVVKKALCDPNPRSRAQVINGGVLVILKGLNLEKQSRPEDMVSIRIWINNKFIVSTSNRTLNSISEIQTELEKGDIFKSSSEFIVRLINKLNYKISDFINKLDEKIDDLDEDIMRNEPNNIRFELAALRRQVVILKRYLSPQNEVVSNILLSNIAWLNDESKSLLNEELNILKKQLEDLSVIREQATILNELLISNISEDMGQRMYKLSIITLIFLPLTFFTGLFGANVGGIPLSQTWYGFMLLAVFCVITVVIEVILFRRVRWL